MDKKQEIIIFKNAHDLFEKAAHDFMQRAIASIYDKGKFSVVLSGGNTAKLFYDTLTSMEYYVKNIPWQKILFFFGDERYLPADDIENNYHIAHAHLFSKVPVNVENIFQIKTDTDNPSDAAKLYEKTLRNAFNIEDQGLPLFDLVFLGLGANAHTASLMPFSEVVRNPIDKQLVASLWVPELNMHRITLTPSALNNSFNIIFLVTGADKENAVVEVLEGPNNPNQYPAQLIHCLYGETNWYLDQLAARRLTPIRKKAIFLDADGVLNKAIIKDGKPVAPINLAELEIPNEVKPCLDKLKAAGYLLICVTNKPDIEDGLMTQPDLDAIIDKMRRYLPIDDIFICYSRNADCFKPKPGLILEATHQYDIDLTLSYTIGDRWSDVAAGQNAGTKTIWINRNYIYEKIPNPPADYTAKSLKEATEWILK